MARVYQALKNYSQYLVLMVTLPFGSIISTLCCPKLLKTLTDRAANYYGECNSITTGCPLIHEQLAVITYCVYEVIRCEICGILNVQAVPWIGYNKTVLPITLF